MATDTQYAWQGDERGVVLKTTTTESFEQQDQPNPSETLKGFSYTEVDGKTTLVKEEFENLGLFSYSVDASVSSEPIESHPKFDDYRDTPDFKKWIDWKKNSTDPALDGWTPEQSESSAVWWLYYFFRQGVTSYQCPRVTVKHTSISSEYPDLSFLGKIADPGGGFTWDGDFLCVGVTAQQLTQGSAPLFNTTVEFMSSAPGRTWDTFLYGSTPIDGPSGL